MLGDLSGLQERIFVVGVLNAWIKNLRSRVFSFGISIHTRGRLFQSKSDKIEGPDKAYKHGR